MKRKNVKRACDGVGEQCARESAKGRGQEQNKVRGICLRVINWLKGSTMISELIEFLLKTRRELSPMSMESAKCFHSNGVCPPSLVYPSSLRFGYSILITPNNHRGRCDMRVIMRGYFSFYSDSGVDNSRFTEKKSSYFYYAEQLPDDTCVHIVSVENLFVAHNIRIFAL